MLTAWFCVPLPSRGAGLAMVLACMGAAAAWAVWAAWRGWRVVVRGDSTNRFVLSGSEQTRGAAF